MNAAGGPGNILPATDGFGNVGKGALVGPRLFNWDMGAFKNIPITERWRAQLRGELFNVWNWHRFVYGGTLGTGRAFDEDVSSPSFGKWTGAISKPRNIQVGAKLVF